MFDQSVVSRTGAGTDREARMDPATVEKIECIFCHQVMMMTEQPPKKYISHLSEYVYIIYTSVANNLHFHLFQ